MIYDTNITKRDHKLELKKIIKNKSLKKWTEAQTEDLKRKSKTKDKNSIQTTCYTSPAEWTIQDTVRSLPCILGGYLKKWKWASALPSYFE